MFISATQPVSVITKEITMSEEVSQCFRKTCIKVFDTVTMTNPNTFSYTFDFDLVLIGLIPEFTEGIFKFWAKSELKLINEWLDSSKSKE